MAGKEDKPLLGMNGQRLSQGARVRLWPRKGQPLTGRILAWKEVLGKVGFQADGDPYGVMVPARNLEVLGGPVAETSTKELRKSARRYGIDGWQEMTREELAASVAAAEDEENGSVAETKVKKSKKNKKGAKSDKGSKNGKVKSGKASKVAKETGKKAVKVDTGGLKGHPKNPFRVGSNQWWYAETLIEGGPRNKLVKAVMPKVDLRPRVGEGKEYDTITVDGRLQKIASILEKEHGWKVIRDGRGKDAVLKVVPPKSKKK